MLRKFKISIDGKEYLVEMEEIGEGTQTRPVPMVERATPVETVVPTKESPKEPEVKSSVAAGADAMASPMPGTISRVLVSIGEVVEVNQPLMILEAMKMENEIVAGKAGKVTGIHIGQGEMVNPGDPLITIS
ncbi:acetyl-CoA carboxylase biotin carboxyl carrier protein subunit [Enterococcus sp. DIV1298c]|uniref:Lipoyl-binding domain-containing protein n=1 Tax=Candidatus Enterococcus mangumiae TaxID=2230878 RepID=A0ABZ2T0N6_9ENTE|nr:MULTISPECIES: acetyl-CoA carboxylase biotin carboxyl carrier protein subunit [unclassified Enterococcus]MBO0460846.1 acetyl-CoA carboxylase biotin carboxyl carrier protein subunit [Enterococcus sp. DIV1298c]MBO0491180.1 acetyl-CoA carboxylase biotin carboxyl carrier protein subunit [Enterococcus sp. DIV1094]